MSKHQKMLDERKQQRRSQRVLFIIGGSFVVLAIAFLLIIVNLPQPAADMVHPEALTRPQASFNSMGNPEAPVKIIEYSNFLCSHCADFALETEHLLVQEYVATGKVYFEYRSSGGGDTAAGRSAEAAYCAGDQGKFWEMHDYLFANLMYWEFTDDRALAYAKAIDLNINQFKDCYNSRKYAPKVEEDGKNALNDGVQGTPSFFLSTGEIIRGSLPYEEFQAKIDAALGQ